MTKAEELASSCSNEIFDMFLNNTGSHQDNISLISKAIFEYGRLVQEAAAKEAMRAYMRVSQVERKPSDIASAIREMTLP